MQQTQTTCLVILATIAIGISLYFLKSVLLPFVIALFVVIGCRPILEFFEKKLKLHRMLAFAATFLLGVSMLAVLGLLVWASIDDLSRHPDDYEQRLNTIANWVVNHLAESSHELTDTDGSGITAADGTNSPVKSTSQAIQELVSSLSNQLQSLLLNLASSLSGMLSYGVLILIFVFFLLLGNGNTRQNQPLLVAEVENQVRRYLVMKTLISIATGFVFGFVLYLFGVPLAILFGMLAFVLNYIPNIGPLIANMLPVPFLVLNSNLPPTSAIICFILISAVQFISGNVIETRLMGKSFDVSPIVLLLSLMFFGLIWGIVGMFLATPIVSIVKIVLQQSPSGRPIAELMAGRWTASTSEMG